MIGVGTKSKKGFNSNPNETSAFSTSVDFAACPSLEGLLKKKNSHGQWKDRFCVFQNGFFMTYKPKGNKPSSELKESIDLKDVESFLIKDEVLHMDMKTGETLLYKGNRLKDWLDCMKQRSNKAQQLFQKSLAENASRGIHIAGWLHKKSHNKYQGFQERYVKVEGHFLRYYKRDIETEELGSANLLTTDFIRPYDDTPDCTVFELQDEDRVFAFQATSNKEMMHWINTLEKVRLSAQAKIQEEIQKKLVEETPYRIRWFDELGIDQFSEKVLAELAENYPDPSNPPDGEGEFSIRDHLDCATGIVEYLQSFVPEIQKCAQRPARYDVLAVMMTMINSFLYERMSTFLIVATLEARFTLKRKLSQDKDENRIDEENESELDGQSRSELIENATLGDLHAIIDWISKYQITIKKIRCPVVNSSSAKDAIGQSSTQAILSTTHLTPKQSRLFELLPDVCKLYVYGGSKGSKGGAASHLYEHCMRVWESVVNNPEEMLQRNNDGSFYTHSPVDMWEAINQHISLATSTNSPVLHVMIADKVVTTLLAVFHNIINYVTTLDTSSKPELREIELEYISALANDTALHIEEVIELIDNFTIAEIRERIDEIFDPLTTVLVKCGETCLKRLASLVMSDVQALLDQVFMPEWMEGNQMHVATATISDYMSDFEEYLVSFWADKFVYTILEEVILSYTRSLLFRKNRPPKTITTTVNTEVPSTPQKSGGFLTSFFQKTKQTITQTITTTVPSHVLVDEESLGRLAQDVNILNAFFSQKAGQETATEFLALMNEISLLLFLDMAGVLQHFTVRCTEYPSAAQAIYEVINAVMKMRSDDFSKSDFDFFTDTTQSLIASAVQEAKEKEAAGIVEGRLGLLYIEVVPKDIYNAPQRITLAQRMKMMSNIPLFGKSTIKKSDSDENREEDEDADYDLQDGGNPALSRDSNERRANSDDRAAIQKSNQLVDDVLEVLQQQDLADETYIQEEELAKQEEELMRKKIGMLSYDGYLEKKSPAHNLWQKRFFKFVTRETHSTDKPYLYSLMWYKKEGGSVIKALEIDKIQSIALICSNRSLSYVLPAKINSLVLQSEAGSSRDVLQVAPIDHEDNNSGKQGGVDYYIFRLVQTDGKDHVLRSAKIDRAMRWINTIAFAGSLAYDSKLRQWTRAAFTFYEEQAAERAKLTSFQTVSATPLPSMLGSTGKSVSNSSAVSESNQNHSNEIDVKSAAMLLQSLKGSTQPQPQALQLSENQVDEEQRSESSAGASDNEELKDSNRVTVLIPPPPAQPEPITESVNPIHLTLGKGSAPKDDVARETISESDNRESEGEVIAATSSATTKRTNRGGRGNRHKPPPPPSDNLAPLEPATIESNEGGDDVVRLDGVGSFENSPRPNQPRRSLNMKRVATSRAHVARQSLTEGSSSSSMEVPQVISQPVAAHDEPPQVSKTEANRVSEEVAEERTATSVTVKTQSMSEDSNDSNSNLSSLQRAGSNSPKSSLKTREKDLSRSSLRVSFAEHLSSSDEGKTVHSFEVEDNDKDKLLTEKGGKKRGCADSCLLL